MNETEQRNHKTRLDELVAGTEAIVQRFEERCAGMDRRLDQMQQTCDQLRDDLRAEQRLRIDVAKEQRLYIDAADRRMLDTFHGLYSRQFFQRLQWVFLGRRNEVTKQKPFQLKS